MADNSYFGWQGLYDSGSEYNKIDFAIDQAIAKRRFQIPVKILAVHGGGTSGGPPTCDVQIYVKQIDGQGNASSHATIYGIPVSRQQSGSSAFIADPVAGDLWMMHVADRDISALKNNNGAESQPGSFRRNNEADGVLSGQLLPTGAPNQYVYFKPNSSGIIIFDAGKNAYESFPTGTTRISIRTDEPAGPSKLIFLGGDGMTGTYDFVQTSKGPSINVKARIG